MKRNLIIAFALAGTLLTACGSGGDPGTTDAKEASSPSNAGNSNSNTAVTDSIADSASNNHNANRADQSGIDTTKQKP
jgi:hypothetical protein